MAEVDGDSWNTFMWGHDVDTTRPFLLNWDTMLKMSPSTTRCFHAIFGP